MTFRPVVKKGAPEDPDLFIEYELDGLDVYYDLTLNMEKEITIGYQKVGKRELLVPGPDRL